MSEELHTCSGYCSKCQKAHFLGAGNSRKYAQALMDQLLQLQRLDFESDLENSKFATDYLFGDARGQMFGVLECEDCNGQTVVLKAFSCQYNSQWELAGWVPPLLDVPEYYSVVTPVDRKIKELGAAIEQQTSSESRQELINQRKSISQQLMKDIHSLYELHNFRGQKSSIYEAFYLDKGIPTGTGDCCAPKLLNFAAQNNLKPLGLSEFYWGKENRSKSREHGQFYESCTAKCQPILGFILCGVEDL